MSEAYQNAFGPSQLWNNFVCLHTGMVLNRILVSLIHYTLIWITQRIRKIWNSIHLEKGSYVTVLLSFVVYILILNNQRGRIFRPVAYQHLLAFKVSRAYQNVFCPDLYKTFITAWSQRLVFYTICTAFISVGIIHKGNPSDSEHLRWIKHKIINMH